MAEEKKKKSTAKKTSTKKSTPKKTTKKSTVKKEAVKNTKKTTTKKASPKKEVKKVEVKEVKEVKKDKKPSVSKKDGKSINTEKLVKKFNIERTMIMPTREEIEAYIKAEEEVDETKKCNKLRKAHYSFIARVCTLVVLILLFITLSVYSIVKGFDIDLRGDISYTEATTINYDVCGTGMYSECLSGDYQYVTKDIDNIKLTFNYMSIYSEKITTDVNYKVVANLKIHNDVNNLYTSTDELIEYTENVKKSDTIAFSSDVDINYKDYFKEASNIINTLGVDAKAELEVSLVKDNNKVSHITIPITIYDITLPVNNADDSTKVLTRNNTNNYDMLYIFIATVSIICTVLLSLYVFNFIYVATHVRDVFKEKLDKILKEYDGRIVNTKKYSVPEDKKQIEVESFDELYDACKSLDGVILYERVNDIKARFYVEDSDKVFVYTMKDEGK